MKKIHLTKISMVCDSMRLTRLNICRYFFFVPFFRYALLMWKGWLLLWLAPCCRAWTRLQKKKNQKEMKNHQTTTPATHCVERERVKWGGGKKGKKTRIILLFNFCPAVCVYLLGTRWMKCWDLSLFLVV